MFICTLYTRHAVWHGSLVPEPSHHSVIELNSSIKNWWERLKSSYHMSDVNIYFLRRQRPLNKSALQSAQQAATGSLCESLELLCLD